MNGMLLRILGVNIPSMRRKHAGFVVDIEVREIYKLEQLIATSNDNRLG